MRARVWLGGVVAVAVTAALGMPAQAAAAGGPPGLFVDTTSIGIAAPGGGVRYYAIPSGHGTDVLAVDLSGSEAAGETTMDRLQLDDRYSIPGVAWDGTTSGLSADGEILALTGPPRYTPRDDSHFALVDTTGREMQGLATITLDGNFGFDSISPDGSTIYMVHYLSKLDPTKYEVRAYDVDRDRLLSKPILDSRTAPIVMRGNPVARAMSPDGVWAYTLYDGAGKTPFVHALNTAEGEALCIDVDALGDLRTVFGLGLIPSADGSTLEIFDPKHGTTVASIETGTWKVTEPGDEAAAPSDEGGGDGVPWAGLAATAAGVALIGGGFVVRRRRRGGGEPEMPPDPELEPESVIAHR